MDSLRGKLARATGSCVASRHQPASQNPARSHAVSARPRACPPHRRAPWRGSIAHVAGVRGPANRCAPRGHGPRPVAGAIRVRSVAFLSDRARTRRRAGRVGGTLRRVRFPARAHFRQVPADAGRAARRARAAAGRCRDAARKRRSRKTAFATGSISRRAIRPASSSTSARTGRACGARSRAGCSTPSPTPVPSRSTGALAGAETVSIDLSRRSLTRGEENFRRNGLDPPGGSAPLHRRRRAGGAAAARAPRRRFDIIILDPPTFSRNQAGEPFQVQRDFEKLVAARARRGGARTRRCCSRSITPPCVPPTWNASRAARCGCESGPGNSATRPRCPISRPAKARAPCGWSWGIDGIRRRTEFTEE